MSNRLVVVPVVVDRLVGSAGGRRPSPVLVLCLDEIGVDEVVGIVEKVFVVTTREECMVTVTTET